jgi:serine/threonine-protein kinase
VQELFHAALERDSEARRRFLAEACAGDTALHEEVASLLAHAGAGPLGEPGGTGPDQEPMPATFGDYRLLRPLGKGGMGRVFLAERAGAGFTQRVALKLLQRDLFHPLLPASELAARFARERHILARLEHPGIARLIDGGHGPDGQPYLAMEYVDGLPLTDYVNHHQADLETRLTLFITVCEAVHYAHQRLVIHRDLKPGNIFVTEAGVAKLLDFGIATLAESDEDEPPVEATAFRTGLWFTPAYASPEQVRRERVTTLSDQYSLGVILYQLLAGVRPYELAGLSQAEVEEAVCRRVPQRPSSCAGPPLARQLRGDLDTIVLKALAKEPDRRYRSVQDLAEDLRRHLDNRPVAARPDSFGYRTRTFVRRHRTAVAGAGLAVAVLAGGLITTSWQARVATAARARAEAALGQSEQVTGFLLGLFQENDPTVTPVDPAFAAQVLERGAARIDQLDGQPAVQARLLDALGLLFLNLSRYEDAEALVSRALALRRQVHGGDHVEVAVGLQHLGRIRRLQGRYPEAEGLYREALAVLQRSVGAEHPAYPDVLSDLAFLLPYLSRDAEAESLYREALAIRRRILRPDDPLVGESIMRVAGMLRRLRRPVEAESTAREGLAFRRRVLGSEDPLVGYTLVNIADIVADDSARRAEAESLYREGLTIQRRAMGERYLGLQHGLGNLAILLKNQGRLVEAESLVRATWRLREANLGRDHFHLGYDKEALADVWAADGRIDDAIALRRDALTILQRALGPDHPVLGGSLRELALLHRRRGDLALADSLLVQSVAIRSRANGPRHPLVGLGLLELGDVSLRRREYAVAEGRLLEALDILESADVPFEPELARIRGLLAAAYRGLGRPAEAARYAAPDSGAR